MTSFNPKYALLGSLFGSSMGGLFGSNSNPADAAMPYLNKIPSTISPYYQPYIDTGLNSMNQYYNQVSQLGTPQGATDIYNQLGSGYTQSPGYQYNVDQQTQKMMQSAAASGQAGTPSQQAALASQVSGMASQDYDNYMTMATGLYNTGLGGLQDLTHQGYQASDAEASDLFKMLMEQSGLAYAGQANKNNSSSDFWSSLLGLGGAAAGGFSSGLASLFA